jgi:subfamily B ATP-binding cassette protein MsbA
MRSLLRLKPYVLRQWPRLIVIVISAILTSILMMGTIATVGPLLKVMMNEEGLHSWANRTLTTYRYGVDFLIHDPNAANFLTVASLKHKSAIDLRPGDNIRSASLPSGAETAASSSAMLDILAFAPGNVRITMRVAHISSDSNSLIQKNVSFITPKLPSYYPLLRRILNIIPPDNGGSKERVILLIILSMIVVTFARCLFRFLQDYFGDKVSQTCIAGLREDTFNHTLTMPVGFFASQGSSDTVSRMVQDTGSIGGGLKVLLTKALREPVTALAMLYGAFYISPKLTLIFLCSAPLTVLAVSNFGKKMKRATKKSLANWAKVLGKLEETIIALKIVKIYNRQKYEHSRFQERNRKLLKNQIRIAKVDAATDPMMEALGMIAISGGMVYGAHWVFTNNMSATSFFLLLAYMGGCAEAIRRASDVWNRVQQANAAAERVFAVVDEPCEHESAGCTVLVPFRDRIEFRNIVFTYPGADRPVLKGIDLTVTAGQNIAIVGPNGSGKTTLVNLLPRFYDPTSGTILIDGCDISKVSLASLRHQMAMVTQNVLTFNDTVAANISYGKPDATREEIIEAAKRSYAHEFIAPLPDGYDTIIGEQGSGLSGGQLQRIIIARAILKNPPIMIFDEAMSQIDADSEAKIHKALDEFMKNRTAFVIAHRFSTVIKADVIVVVQDGKIIAKGKHDRLVNECPLYNSLYQTQLLKD